MSIQVTIKNVYGRDLIYPHDDKAKTFARLVGQDTLTKQDIELIKQLGFTIEVVQERVTL